MPAFACLRPAPLSLLSAAVHATADAPEWKARAPNWPNPLPPAGAIAQSCDGAWVGEIARVALPSGRGTLSIPSALYVTAQATREPFVPDHPYAGRMRDDEALTAWVGRTLDGLKD